MRAFSMLLALPALVAGAFADDIAFLDGRVWLDVKVITKETSYVIVKHGDKISTVHAAELLPGSASILGIRPPTAEEKAEQEKAEQAQRDAMVEREARADREEQAGRERGAEIQAARDAAPRAAPRIVNEYCSVVYSPRRVGVSPPAITHIQGRVLARLAGGAIVQGDGMPTGQTYGDYCWVVGTCFIHESSQLNATTGGSPINSRVNPAGEFRYTDSQGVVHVLRAYRF